jgi:ornithine cyclodeaminase/alanine dehydrogenase-like protein (mu-crystallin family)
MDVLVVNRTEVATLLPMEECMRVMEGALATLTRGGAILPLRPVIHLPDGASAMAAMPAYLDMPKALGAKLITVFPRNEGTPYESHQGATLLFEAEHGCLVAIMDAGSITAIRTAAVSGVAARLLARDDATDLALLGSGVQARTHLEAMLVARPLRRVRVWSRARENASTFAADASRRHGIPVQPVETARDAVEGAAIICTVTSSREPVLRGEWLAPGAHINAVGASVPTARELDTAAVARSRLFVDRRESALHEAGDFLIPRAEGAIGDDHIRGELGEVLLGQCRGRESPDDITLFKSLGIAVEDVAAAVHIYQKGRERGIGTWVRLSTDRG